MKKRVLALFILWHIASNSLADDGEKVIYEFAPIVVTGQRYEMPQKDVAATISIIQPIELRSTNLSTVAEAVSYLTPGVFTTRKSTMGYGVSSLAAGTITIRGIGGMTNGQVLILIDGRPDFQGIFSHPLNDAYLLDNVDHIEVHRGPASAVYGSNALGGVINIITQKLPAQGFDTHLSAQYGSHQSQRYVAQHSGGLGKFDYFTVASYQHSDGHRDDASYTGQNYALKLGYQVNPHYQISFNGNTTPYQFNDPGPVGVSLAGYFDHGDITRSSMDLTLSNQFAKTDGMIKLHGNFGKHQLSDGWESDDQTNGLLVFQNFQLMKEIKSTVGFDIKRYGGTSTLNHSKLGTFFNDEYALYLHLQAVWMKKIILASGIRYERNTHFGDEWIPKAGLVYHPMAQTAIRASAAKGFRTPSIKDLFLFPPHNADLQPERLWNYEIGVNQTFGNIFSADLCGYYYEGDQLIESVRGPSGLKNQNTGSNRARGFELALHFNPWSELTTRLSYSYLNSETTLPFAPNKLNFFINYHAGRLDVSLFGEYVSDLYTSYQLDRFPPKQTIEKLTDYSLFHLKLEYRLFAGMSAGFGLENALDSSYQILKGYPMPGRTIYGKISFKF